MFGSMFAPTGHKWTSVRPIASSCLSALPLNEQFQTIQREKATLLKLCMASSCSRWFLTNRPAKSAIEPWSLPCKPYALPLVKHWAPWTNAWLDNCRRESLSADLLFPRMQRWELRLHGSHHITLYHIETAICPSLFIQFIGLCGRRLLSWLVELNGLVHCRPWRPKGSPFSLKALEAFQPWNTSEFGHHM